MSDLSSSSLFFFFNDTATTEIYTLSLHDALPILSDPRGPGLSAHEGPVADAASRGGGRADRGGGGAERAAEHHPPGARTDRKSTRLNSSHGYISYAVFCLKKKKKKNHGELSVVSS